MKLKHKAFRAQKRNTGFQPAYKNDADYLHIYTSGSNQNRKIHCTVAPWYIGTLLYVSCTVVQAWAEEQTKAPHPTPMTDIHDIKPALPADPGWDWLLYILAGLALLAGLAALWWFWRRRKTQRPQRYTAPPMPPDTEALQRLDALAADGITGKAFYFTLSAIVRRYLERRYQFPAQEMTTEELLPRVEGLCLENDLARQLKDFCRTADPVKFAGAAVQQGRMDQDLVFARELVQRTTTVIEPVNKATD